MRELIGQMGRADSKAEALKIAYNELSSRYHGERIKTYSHIFSLLTHDINKLWKKKGFLHCNHINNLLITLLVGSGHFKKEDLKKRWTLVWYASPHQYMKVKLDNNTSVDVDIWGKNYGIPFGKHAYGFNSKFFAVE